MTLRSYCKKTKTKNKYFFLSKIIRFHAICAVRTGIKERRNNKLEFEHICLNIVSGMILKGLKAMFF